MALFGPSGDSTESSGLFGVAPERSKYKPKRTTVPGATAPSVPGQSGGTAPKVTSQELPPIFGLGQGILKGLLTSSAGSIEVVDAVLKGMQKPPILGGDFATPNIPNNVSKNVAALWGPKDVFAPGAWEDLKTGEDVLKDTLGVQEEMLKLRMPGIDIPIGTNLFWGGLALDIAADPLTYGTFGLAVPFKAAAAFTRAAGTGSKLAAAREVSEKLAQQKVTKPVEVVNQIPVGVSKKLQKDGLQNVRNNIIRTDPKAADFIKAAEAKLANNTYKTVRVTEPRTLSQASRDIVVSAIDAGAKAAVNSAISVTTVRFLQKYAQRDVKAFGRGLVANVVKNKETGAFDVLSGNGIKLGEASTKQQAQRLAENLKRGLADTATLTPVSAVKGAREVTEEAAPEAPAESVVVPTAEGGEVTIETYVPHQADDGKVYVYDGENIAEFENLPDAERWVQASQGLDVATEVEPVLSGKSGNYIVTVGENVTRFTTKREANAYMASVRSGEIPTGRRVTTGGTPLIDTPAPSIPVKEALKAPTKAETSALKKVLKGIDDIAKKASGWRPLVNKGVANQIRQILSKTQADLDNFLIKLDSSQVSAMGAFVKQEITSKEFFAILESTGVKGTQLASVIRTLPIETTKGTKEFGELLDKAKGNFLNITKANEGVEGNVLESQILTSIKVRFYERAQQLITKAVKPASDPQGRYDAIVAVAGEKIADRIKATGYLTKPNKESQDAVKSILQDISVGNTEVSYQGYDDLIAGLKRGDEVSADVLDQIISKIDPEGALKAQFVQATAEPTSAYLTRLLTREGGVDSILEAERRLALAGDVKLLTKHPNLAYEAEVASLIEQAVKGNKSLIEELELVSTRQAAAESFARYSVPVQRDSMDSLGRAIMGDPKKGGEGGRQAFKAGILEEATGGIRTSTLGDEIVATGEAFSDGSRAMFNKQLQQSDEVRLIASIVAKRTYRAGQGRQIAKEAGKAFEDLNGDEKLAYLIERLSAARDGATALGFRFVRAKNRDDIMFQKSYNAAIQKAKETKTTPNFSALAEKHTAYLPMADILQVLTKTEANDALIKAFFPTGKVNLKRNTMDWYGLGDAARRVLEMDAAGEVFDVNEIAQRIMRRGAGREVPSERRLQIFKEAANEIAEALTEPQVVAQLKAVHLDNAASVVQDFIQKAEDYSRALFDIMDEAWIAMHASDDLSEPARMEAVRKFFRKFVLTSDIMRLQGGPIAEVMFRASAMLFADGGKVLPPGKLYSSLSKSDQEFYNLLRQDEMRLFRESLTRFHRFSDIPTAPIGREGMAPPKPAAQAKAQENLDIAMELYAKHMDELAKVEATGDLNLIKTWEKDMAKIQKQLDGARTKAWDNWVQTYHWHPVDGWIRTEQFDHAKALSAAEQAHAVYVAGTRGVADRELFMADTAPVIPPHRILSKAEKAKFLKKHRVRTEEALVDNAVSLIDDISRNVADEVQIGALDLPELGGTDKLMIAEQNMVARSVKEATEIRLYKALATYKEKIPASTVEFNRLFRPLLDENTPVLAIDRVAAKLKLLAQKWSATTRGTGDAITIMRTQENMATQVAADYTAAMDDLVRSMREATPEDIDAAWTSLRDDVPLAADDVAIRSELTEKLAPFVNAILKSEATSVLSKEGIDGARLGEAFARYGLTDEIGFPSARELEGKTAEELVASLFDTLPFGATPPKFKTGSVEAIAWAKSRDKFRQSEIPAPLAFSRMFSAIQQLKAEQGIAQQVVAQFGWKQFFKNIEEAKRAGWVQLEAVGKQNIARFLPDAEGGNLFHPDIAENMGRVFREWNNVYEGNALNPFLRSSMRFLGFLKFTQTTARPGHHVVNLLGDGSNMIIFGVRNPRTVFDGLDIANRYTRTNFAAEYGQLGSDFIGKDFEAKARRLVGALNDMPDAEMPRGELGDSISFTFYRDGKPKAVNFGRDEFASDLARRGVLVPGFVQGDIMNATNDIMLTGTTAGNKRGLDKVWSIVARPGHEIMRGLSAGTAAYSNVIRASTAIRMAQSRSWSSYEEMMNAVVKEVNLIHPTVQSLASAEKKWGRLFFTYYTWLRVAHNALWDMAINHTGAMLAVPKAQYNYAQMQGFDPQSPAVPWENQNVLPDYISYSVYGPTQMGPQGPQVYRPPLMLLDVLDFWKIYYDPSKELSTNAVQMAGQLGGNVVGPSLNILGQPILKTVTDAPGGPRNLGEAAEDAVSNLGFMNALTGMGLYTPYRYRREDTTNPLTDADRQRLMTNWLTGARLQDIYRPINVKLGQSQYGSRVKQYNERITEENRQKVQQFVDEKSAEGYTREQIIDMLRQMGIR